MKRKRVLFVCVGNACRSQMAEGFARTYGKDVLEAESAGLMAASMIPEVTKKVMIEKGISLDPQFPKGIEEVRLDDVDLVLNMSGVPLRNIPVKQVRAWNVEDPMGQPESFHRRVRDDVERRVMALVLELRAGRV